jgi:uncharacterized surface protein with fasciclin (FAS1) repeats
MPLITDLIGQDKRFERLVEAVEAAGLRDMLSATKEYTVFAPMDEAFEAMPDVSIAKLLQDREGLRRVLSYHIVEDEYMCDELLEGVELTALNGRLITVRRMKNQIYVEDAMVVEPDIDADNGVIHGIDQLLLPY